ncbi:MAG: protein kinase [Gemmatimonadota bacterium]|nr:protein kinase [Gemmatimonadota bacterium]
MTEGREKLINALRDRYEIERELGAGGMATVYLAQDIKHDRKVAVKVLKPELAAVLGAERFIQEIKTTANLQHPHILPLFDSGEANGFLYYVMPFIDGETIRDRLNRETQLGIEESVKITTEIADALDYAHRNNVIHRDIKPENILLHDGRPMVADFGIALAVSAAAGGRMTETGLSLGTPHYMSPEQATADKELTSKSDIYSLGSVLYEMLTGEPPHMGTSAQQIIMKIVTDHARPASELRKNVPRNVSDAIDKSLEKLAADRFATAKEFAEALANTAFRCGTQTQLAEEKAARSASSTNRILAGMVALLSLALVVSVFKGRKEDFVERYALALPPEQAVDSRGFVALTQNGSKLVYLGPAEQPGLMRIWVKERDEFSAQPIPETGGASTVAISPDGTRLAVVLINDIWTTPFDGGGLTNVGTGVSGAGHTLAWLEDGSFVFTARDRLALKRIFAGSSGDSAVTIWESDSLFPQNITALPDARGVLFSACRAPCNSGDLYLLDFEADSAKLIFENVNRGKVAQDVLFFVAGALGDSPLYAVGFDPKDLTVRGEPVLLGDSVTSPIGVVYFDVTSDGTGIWINGGGGWAIGDQEMIWVGRDGQVTPVDTAWQFRVTQFVGDYGWDLSPDGRQLVIGLNTNAGDDIWVKQLPRGPLSRVSFGMSPERRPRWRPDNRWVTFVTDTSFTMRRADGTGRDSIIWRGRADEALLSDDGEWVILRMGATTAAAGGRDIYAMKLGEDSVPRPLVATPYDEMAVQLSPDGRWLAYQSDETGRKEVYIRSFPDVDDVKVQVSSNGGTGPLWARDGGEFFYVRQDNVMMAVPIASDGTPITEQERELFPLTEEITDLTSWFYTPWDVAADGRFIMTKSVSRYLWEQATIVVVENWLQEARALLEQRGRGQ